MNVSANVRNIPAATVIDGVTLSLTAEEAKKLRRVCYYNITVGAKFASNPVGGEEKGDAITSFLSDLGNSLKSKGIERF